VKIDTGGDANPYQTTTEFITETGAIGMKIGWRPKSIERQFGFCFVR